MTLKAGTYTSTGNRTTGRKKNHPMKPVIAAGLTALTLTIFVKAVELPTHSESVKIPETITVKTVVLDALPSPTIVDDTYYYDVPLDESLQKYITFLCGKYDVPTSLVMAMIEHESQFDPNAVSGTNDYGLMQINTINAEWLADELRVTDLFDPYQNCLAGIRIISDNLKAVDGDIGKALMRYNCGATGAANLWEQGIYSTEYSRSIETLYDGYEKTRLGADTL